MEKLRAPIKSELEGVLSASQAPPARDRLVQWTVHGPYEIHRFTMQFVADISPWLPVGLVIDSLASTVGDQLCGASLGMKSHDFEGPLHLAALNFPKSVVSGTLGFFRLPFISLNLGFTPARVEHFSALNWRRTNVGLRMW